MAKSKTHDEIIETMVDYKKGLRTLETGAKVLAEQTGLEDDVAKALIKGMNKSYFLFHLLTSHRLPSSCA